MVELLFPSAVFRLTQSEDLSVTKKLLKTYISQVKPNEWNVCQSESMFDDRLSNLFTTISTSSYNMLLDQGYDMTNKQTRISEIWGQEFRRSGQHIEHIHSDGAQITGFYFVSVPANSSLPLLFDPRPGKKQISMRESDPKAVTFASPQVVFEIKAGDLMLFNSWLPHGFTRHESDEPLQFLHFNVIVEDTPMPNVEIV
ncbi:MAG: hypothetical protein EB127_04380 [Alphaproteobacteria bacterium]|nr:hypothetical protein [Alphaproteobacteria bacterium]